MSDGPRNVLTVWARLVAATLVSSGVRDVVVSPGSRSTPFVLALDARPELRLTSVIDERSAAFVALGIARASGRPAAVLATSGTAPAHWLPAVIEASITKLPLVLLSANRPLALAHSGAAQTIDQTKLFGSWVRHFVDPGDPRADRSALEGLVRAIGRAVALARGSDPGPVHVDLHADKPLEPVEPVTDVEHALAALGAELGDRGVPTVSGASLAADEAFAGSLADALATARRPLVVAGPRSARPDDGALLAACAAARIPLAPEATSQLRFVAGRAEALEATELLFACERFATEHAPDLVVQVGALPTAPTLERAWARVPRFVVDAGGIHDPIGAARAISTAPAGATLVRALAGGAPRLDDGWSAALRRAEACAWASVERALATPRSEGAVVRASCLAAPSATLVIGNSLPVRTLDRFVRSHGAARRVLSQRGASGIDGIVSGAVGAALGGSTPTLAILGDVSFVHDLNALGPARRLEHPLVVVVVDNGGGRIFEALPIARTPGLARAMPLFTTPHEIDLAAAVRAFGVPCVETDDPAQVARAVSRSIAQPGATVIRAVVDPDDAARSFPALVRAFEDAFYGGPP